MDARYNCQNDARTPAAPAWWHVPDLNATRRGRDRSWRDVVDARGGALGALQSLRECDGAGAGAGLEKRTINVVFAGCSYLRRALRGNQVDAAAT